VGEPASSEKSPQKRGIRGFFGRHGRLLWWLHSGYALALGAFVVTFARKGFANARWLTIGLAAIWIVLVLFFRLHGSGKEQAPRDGALAKARFYFMTYVLKNLYQTMLFFLLPFYWEAVTWDSPNRWFLVGLIACAFLATLDVVFDHVLMKWKLLASSFYVFTLFAAANLVIPALIPETRSDLVLIAAAIVASVAFWTIHVPPRVLVGPKPLLAMVLTSTALGFGMHAIRFAVPPVALHVSHAGIGPQVLDSGVLAMEVTRLRVEAAPDGLTAVTDVAAPAGVGDAIVHVWRRDGDALTRRTELAREPADDPESVRVRSSIAGRRVAPGSWSVDVETAHGQLIGRTLFEVVE
jgi:hypothetical protein